MAYDLATFASALAADPLLGLILALTLGATIVNGATDAPNAIATVVGSRAMRPTPAILMAAAGNFIGLVAITAVSSAVAKTIYHMVDFGGDAHAALVALAAAMVAIIVWGAAAWWFGIPTSQSHSLIAGVTGGAIALNGLAGVVASEWMLVIYGMAFSLVAGFILGILITRLMERLFSWADRRIGNIVCMVLQDVCACALSFLHGAQDGQKFMSIGLLGIALAFGMETSGETNFPLWLMILCSAAISLGTLAGGKRIIKSVGMDMVKLEAFQGFAASLSTFVSLFLATFGGLPVSTTHTNTTAIMGVGAAKSPKSVKWSIAIDMVKTWVLTFPGCGILGFICAKLFLMIL